MDNIKTNYQYLHDDGNWYLIEIKKCSTARARGTINQGRPSQPVYIKDGKEHAIRYRRPTAEVATAELHSLVECGDGTCNERYRIAAMTDSPEEPRLFRLFVYGTLKRGFWNHEHYCQHAISIEKGTLRGRLYELPSGIAVLEVPDEDILAVGTTDPLDDVRIQETIGIPAEIPDSDGWQEINGEIMVFANPSTDIPPIDRLEGFNPCRVGMYQRVLLLTTSSTGVTIPAWCFVASDRMHSGKPTGRCVWP